MRRSNAYTRSIRLAPCRAERLAPLGLGLSDRAPFGAALRLLAERMTDPRYLAIEFAFGNDAAALPVRPLVQHDENAARVESGLRLFRIAGNARHCMIGSDLDGAFGREQSPADIATIADLARLPARLAARGYSEEEVRGIAHGNFLRFLRGAWG